MGSIKTYDWSLLTHQSITTILNKIRHEIVGKSLTPAKFTKKIRETIRNSEIPVGIKRISHKNTEKEWVWIAGEYWSCKDRRNKTFLNLFLQFNPETKSLRYSYRKFQRLVENISDTLLHEIIHARQYRRRNFKKIPGYMSMAESNNQKNEQEYYGHPDEIDAYAFNIACELDRKFDGKSKEIIKYLNQDLNDRRLKENSYKKYLRFFNYDHNHTIIKKLKKKIIHYLPYAKLGKPYKTSDWLKK